MAGQHISLHGRKSARVGSFFIHDSTWCTDILVVVGMERKKSLQIIKRRFPDFADEEGVPDLADVNCPAARVLSRGSSQHVLWLRWWPEKIFDYGTLSHEVFHLVDRTLRGKGITLSDDSDEAYAYLIGKITQDMLVGFSRKEKQKPADER